MSVLFVSRTNLTVNHICYNEDTWVDVLIATSKRGCNGNNRNDFLQCATNYF